MKSFDKRDKAKLYRKLVNVIEDNLILILDCVREEFGVGDVRMKRILDRIEKKVDHFNEMIDDGVFDDKYPEMAMYSYSSKVRVLLKKTAHGTLPDELVADILEDTMTASQGGHNEKVRKEKKYPKLSVSEAERLRADMMAFRGYGQNIIEKTEEMKNGKI